VRVLAALLEMIRGVAGTLWWYIGLKKRRHQMKHQKTASARAQRAVATLERECMEWNARHTIGTEVEYHPVIGQSAHRVTRTRSSAYVLSGHTSVIFVESESGCVALDAIIPVRRES
jgi:hypothetical protein